MNEDLSAVQQPETDNHDDDVRAALEELKGSPVDSSTKVVIDNDEAGKRARDEAGRFTEGDNKPRRETLTLKNKPEVAPPVVADPAAAPAVQTPAAPAIKAPDGIRAAMKAKFSELSPEWQAEIARRDAETHHMITVHDEERNFGRRINEISAPYLPVIRTEGADIPKAFENYLQTAYALRTGSPLQKAQALHAIAHQFNVDLNLPLQQGAGDPRYAYLEKQVSDMSAKLQGQDHQHQLREDQGLKSQIESFASTPGHEHFDKVRSIMGSLLENDKAKDLEDAYQQALWSDPEIRSGLITAHVQSESEKRLTEQKAKADAARAAAPSITGSPGHFRPAQGNGSVGSIEDDLRAAFRDHTGRV